MKIALVLGGTVPHRALVDNLKLRGFRTVLVDNSLEPPASLSADEHIRESAMDSDKVYEIAMERQAAVVMSVCLDRTIPVVGEVSDRLGLPSIYTRENSRWFTDKEVMKQRMADHGISVPQGVVSGELAEVISAGFQFPTMVKPVDSTGSLGVSMATNRPELEAAFHKAQAASLSGLVVVEEFLKGREVSVDVIVVDGKAHVLLIRERLNRFAADGSVQCYATVAPASIEQESRIAIERAVASLPGAFGLKNAPVLVQGMLTGTDAFKVIEVAVRIGGGPSGFRTVMLKTGLDLLDAAVASNLGEPILLSLRDSGLVYASISLYATGGRLVDVVGMDELLRNGIVIEHYRYKSVGTEFASVTSARNRVGAVIVTGKDEHELDHKTSMMYKTLRFVGEGGEDLLDRRLAFGSSHHSA